MILHGTADSNIPVIEVRRRSRRPDIDTELQRPRLTKAGRTNPRAAGIVDIHEATLVVREPDDRFDRFERQQVIGHSETGERDASNRSTDCDWFSKSTQ